MSSVFRSILRQAQDERMGGGLSVFLVKSSGAQIFKLSLLWAVSFFSIQGLVMAKSVVLIVAHSGYQPQEYGDTRAELEKAGYDIVVASETAGATTDTNQKTGPIAVAIDALKLADHAGIFIIGGSGAQKLIDNPVVHKIMQEARDKNLVWGAICISPRILCNAKLVDGKKITGWDGDNQLKIIVKKQCPTATVIEEAVVIDGNLITANGPKAAKKFGEAIVTQMKKRNG